MVPNIDLKTEHLKELLTLNQEHIKEVLALKLDKVELEFKLAEKALEVQTRETERRLEALNNETGRVKAMENKYIQVDVFEAKMLATNNRVDALSKGMTELFESRILSTNNKVDQLSKLAYIGVGILATIQIVLGLLWIIVKAP